MALWEGEVAWPCGGEGGHGLAATQPCKWRGHDWVPPSPAGESVTQFLPAKWGLGFVSLAMGESGSGRKLGACARG